MEAYIKGNKAAWEEAFENRAPSWGEDIVLRVGKEDYPFFEEDMKNVLKDLDIKGKAVGQFCSNNGRELLSLVKSGEAKGGVGFDIAENQVAFANTKAAELGLPCKFEAINVYDIGDGYKDTFDVVIITIGALCWFRDLERFFGVVSGCMKPGAVIVIHEQHPFTNMISAEDEPDFDPAHPIECKYSYFEHEWTGNEGMYYMTGKTYPSKIFTDYTHPLSEIMEGMTKNGLVITGFREYAYDISGGFENLDHKGYPLSMILEGRKEQRPCGSKPKDFSSGR